MRYSGFGCEAAPSDAGCSTTCARASIVRRRSSTSLARSMRSSATARLSSGGSCENRFSNECLLSDRLMNMPSSTPTLPRASSFVVSDGRRYRTSPVFSSTCTLSTGGQLWWAQIGPFFPGRTAILMLEVMLGACESDPRKFLEDAGFWAGTRFGQVRALGGSGSVRRRVSRCCGAQDCTHGAGSQDFAV
jgi:hypothetical protein